MEAYNFFVDQQGRLRSGWRLAIFGVAFWIVLQLIHTLLVNVLAIALHLSAAQINDSLWSVVAGHGAIFISALLVGWVCAALLEQLPFRAIGLSPHKGWVKNLALGSALGAVALFLAALLAMAAGSITFRFDPAGAGMIGRTLVTSVVVFVFAGAAEEILCRGYPLQTFVRANWNWLGVLITSVGFAALHLGNPNVTPGSFVNTALAGVWLAVAYVRTRSLWLPIGLHWSWNWVQASLLGLPVSGSERYAPAPLLKAVNAGPDWFTGGAYGIEGGAACTVALIVSIIVIWRLKLFSRMDVSKHDASAA